MAKNIFEVLEQTKESYYIIEVKNYIKRAKGNLIDYISRVDGEKNIVSVYVEVNNVGYKADFVFFEDSKSYFVIDIIVDEIIFLRTNHKVALNGLNLSDVSYEIRDKFFTDKLTEEFITYNIKLNREKIVLDYINKYLTDNDYLYEVEHIEESNKNIIKFSDSDMVISFYDEGKYLTLSVPSEPSIQDKFADFTKEGNTLESVFKELMYYVDYDIANQDILLLKDEGFTLTDLTTILYSHGITEIPKDLKNSINIDYISDSYSYYGNAVISHVGLQHNNKRLYYTVSKKENTFRNRPSYHIEIKYLDETYNEEFSSISYAISYMAKLIATFKKD